MSEEPIGTVGRVLEVCSGRLCRVVLENGKEVLGYLGKAFVRGGGVLEEGMMVALEMTPFDFSKARIVGVVGDMERGGH